MPKLKRITMLRKPDVFKYIQRLETSIYADIPLKKLVETIKFNDAQRYLAELCLYNDKEKSRLEDIMKSDDETEIQ